MTRPAFLIAADANLPWQVKRAARREPQAGGMRGLPVMTGPAFLIAGEANLAGAKLSGEHGRNHYPESEACQ